MILTLLLLSLNAHAYLTPSGGSSVKVAVVFESQPEGTEGGTFTSSAWQTRLLNTEQDPDNILSLSGNQITLQAGTYYLKGIAPAYAVNRHKARFYNITGSVELCQGVNNFAGNFSVAEVDCIVTLAGETVIQLEHQCQTTQTTNGFGSAAYFGSTIKEVYSVVTVTKLK